MAIANSDGSIILTTKLDISPISKALNTLKGKFASLKEQKSAIQTLTMAIKDQQFVIKQLEMEYALLISQGKGNSKNAEELQNRLKLLRAELNQLTGAASAMGVKTAAASTKAAQGLKQFGKRIAGIVKSALIFSLLYKVMQSVVKLFQNILMSDEEFRQDWEELKAAFYAAAYPIVQLIVPAIKFIVQQVRDWAVSIGKVAAALQGMSYSELVEQAQASKEAADNYADMEKSSKKTADNVKKQLAAFDDIQILSSGNETTEAENYSGFEALQQYETSGEENMISNLMSAISGALTAIGIILLFKGAISWGIGFIIAGAASWAISEIATTEFSEDPIINSIAKITESIGVSLAAVGLILLMKGIWTWGLAFVVAGASIWAITEIATGEFSTDPIVNTLIKIMGIVGVSLLAIGIIMMVFGQITPLSLGLIVAGAVSLASAVAFNTEAIVEAIREPMGAIMAIVGGALLVLGIILVCTGVGIPLGIALIVAGAVALVTPIALNWNAIVDWVKGAWEAVKGVWNRYIAPVFTAKFWLDLAKTCGNGLIGGFESAVNGIIWLFEKMINFVVDGLNLFLRGVDSVISAVGNVFGQDWSVATIPSANLGRVKIPRLAQGAVIPPNREFLAVLGDQKQGTNIETPLDTMVQAFNKALDSRGNNGAITKEEHYYLDENEIMSIIYKLAKRGEQMQGENLVESW